MPKPVALVSSSDIKGQAFLEVVREVGGAIEPTFRTEALILADFYRYNHAYRLPSSCRRCRGSSVRVSTKSPCPGI